MISAKPATTWGHKAAAWDAAKAEAKTVLERVAKAGQLISYSELSRKLRAITFQPEGYDFHGLLGQLSEESDTDSKGMISALVVRMENGRPGTGFFTLGKELGRDVSDGDAFWTAELKSVYRAFA